MKLTVQGREAYAYTGGRPFDPALPCIVFVHGAVNDHSVWTLLSRWFAHHGHAVLAVDLPGHMRSAGPAPPHAARAEDGSCTSHHASFSRAFQRCSNDLRAPS